MKNNEQKNEQTISDKPVAWVPMGDKAVVHIMTPHPAWHMLTTSEAQAEYWRKECNLLVAPLFMGKVE